MRRPLNMMKKNFEKIVSAEKRPLSLLPINLRSGNILRIAFCCLATARRMLSKSMSVNSETQKVRFTGVFLELREDDHAAKWMKRAKRGG